jgi:hypothetical protein
LGPPLRHTNSGQEGWLISSLSDIQTWASLYTMAMSHAARSQGHQIIVLFAQSPSQSTENLKTSTMLSTLNIEHRSSCEVKNHLFTGTGGFYLDFTFHVCEVKNHLFTGTGGFYLDLTFHVSPFKILNFTLSQVKFCFPAPAILKFNFLMTDTLSDKNPSPTEEEIRRELAGHYCRCGSHYLVI